MPYLNIANTLQSITLSSFVLMNNPAARLLTPLRKIAGMRNNGNQAWPIWSEVLGVDGEDYPMVVEQLAEFYKLPAEVRKQVEQIPNIRHQLYLQWMPAVTTAMKSAPWNSGINQFAQHLDATVIQALEFCEELLSRNCFEQELDKEELRELSSRINELSIEVEGCAVELSLKRFMLYHLDKIRTALRSYHISGALPILDAFNSAIGSAASNEEVARQVSSTDVGKKFWRVVRKAAVILSVSSNLIQLLDKVEVNPSVLDFVDRVFVIDDSNSPLTLTDN